MKILIALIALMPILNSRAQTGVYSTYEDYINGDMIPMKEAVDFEVGGLGGAKIFFLDTSGKKVVYNSKRIWGFIFKNQLFRCIGADMSAVIEKGRICYYENGVLHMQMIFQGRNGATFIAGNEMYFSEGLNGKCYDSFRKLCRQNAAFKSFKECMIDSKATEYKTRVGGERDFTENFKRTRACVAAFNADKSNY